MERVGQRVVLIAEFEHHLIDALDSLLGVHAGALPRRRYRGHLIEVGPQDDRVAELSRCQGGLVVVPARRRRVSHCQHERFEEMDALF